MGNYFFQWIAKKPLKMCECCGKNSAGGTNEYFPQYCAECNDWRCDVFPGTHDQNGPHLKWHLRIDTKIPRPIWDIPYSKREVELAKFYAEKKDENNV